MHPPVQFGSYLLTALLGYGATGRVYKAYKLNGDQVFAIKALPLDIVSPRAKQAIEREAQVAQALRVAKCDHLLLPTRFEPVGAQEVLVMPYVEGWTLKDVLAWCRREAALDPKMIVEMVIQICRGLTVAHDLAIDGVFQRLVHRDLKPANVLVGRDGIVRILDFGIAKFRDRIGEETRQGRMVGTPYYLSPEQAMGRTLDHRSDLFALGSVLYEAATGQNAFPLSVEEGVMGVVQAIARATVESLKPKVDELDRLIPGAGNLLASCWHPDPEERMASAFDLEFQLSMVVSPQRGLSLNDWILAHASMLPAQVQDGDFGKFGPPPEILPDDLGKTSIFLPALRSDALAVLSDPEAEPIPASASPTTRLPPPEPDRGVPFGRYRLLNLLGSGGHASVYRALTRGGKIIALKVMHPDLTGEEDARRLLETEAQLGSLLQGDPSPYVVQIFPIERIGGHLCLPMSYIHGWTLDQLLYKLSSSGSGAPALSPVWGDRGLPVKVVLDIMIQTCSGLAHLHRLSQDGRAAGVVHRDLKPGNIMVTRKGEVKILDFGVARMDDAVRTSPRTRAGVARGTPAYMSPEQATGRQLDGRSDLFSLGTILYELLLARLAFPLTAPAQAMFAIVSGNADDLRADVARVAPELSQVVADCHARDPGERFQRAGELMHALQSVAYVHGGVEGVAARFVREETARLPQEIPEGFWGSVGAPEPVLEGDRETNIFHALPDPGSLESLELKFVSPLTAALDEPSLDSGSDDEDARPTEIIPRAQGGYRVEVQPLSPPTRAQPGYEASPLTRLTPAVADAQPSRRLHRPLLAFAAGALLLLVGIGSLFLGKRVPVEAEVSRTSEKADSSTPEPVLEPVPELSPLSLHSETTPMPVPERTSTPQESAHETSEMIELTPELVLEPVAEPQGLSKLAVHAEPTSAVYLDGELLGETPLSTREISSGQHALRIECLVCSEPQAREMTIMAEPEETVRRVVRFPP